MDKALRPQRFEIAPSFNNSSKELSHWFKTFEYYLETLPTADLNKLHVLTNFVGPNIYECFSECTLYDAAVTALKTAYIKPTNEVFARHLLATQ